MRYVTPPYILSRFFFFNDTATTEIYTLSLHDALPICHQDRRTPCRPRLRPVRPGREVRGRQQRSARADPRDWRDRKSTRLNSSHLVISYAVFCLKKKKQRHAPDWRVLPENVTNIA